MNKSKTSLTLSVTSKTENVSYVIKTLENFCLELDFEKKFIETLLIATDEAITNIVLHAYSGKVDGKIHITFSLKNDVFIIEMEDYGKSFTPVKQSKKNSELVDRLKIGGYGLVLMNSLMDELKFIHDDEKKVNLLTMKKYLK